MKNTPTLFRGIEFIRISELPKDQRISISETLDRSLVIKIRIDGVTLHDCIQWKDYLSWQTEIISVHDNVMN
jgi:hypothetical protein